MSLWSDPRSSDPNYWHIYEFFIEEHDGRTWGSYRSRAEAKDISDLHRVICERFSGVGHGVVYASPIHVGFVDAPKS